MTEQFIILDTYSEKLTINCPCENLPQLVLYVCLFIYYFPSIGRGTFIKDLKKSFVSSYMTKSSANHDAVV